MTRDANACTGGPSKCADITQTPYRSSKMSAAFTG